MMFLPRFLMLAAAGMSLVTGRLAAQDPPQPRPLTRAMRAALLDTTVRVIRGLYVLPDTATLMAEHLLAVRSAGRFDSAATPGALATAVTRALREVHRDLHLAVVFDPEEAARMADTTRREARDTRTRDRRANFQFREARILPGNIGYLEFYQFADTSVEARRTVRAAMQFVAHTDALILDLRDNRGGSAAMAGEIGAYFVKDSVRWSRTYNRLLDRWSDGVVVNDPAVTGGTYLGMPITVLVSRWTYSAGEGLAYALQHGRDARVVGEPTGGGAHVVRRVSLGGGFIGFIPYIRSLNLRTNSNWEGTGVLPDLEAGAPDALLRGLEAILSERMATAPDSGARQAADFARHAARAEARLTHLPTSALTAFLGDFAEYSFFVSEGRLHSANRSRNGRVDRLVPISATRFQIDHESQVEFLVEPGGGVERLRLYWSDGWIDVIGRTPAR
jgi:hypothetical protein